MVLAASEQPSPAYVVGRLMGMVLIPGVGLLLLILGLRKRGESRRQAPQPGYGPGYPAYPGQPGQLPGAPYPPWPAGPPGYAGTPYPPPPPPPARGSSGTVLIVLGAVLLVAGLAGVAANLGRHSGTLSVGECISAEDYGAGDMRPTPVDCGQAGAVYELASTGGGSATCPDGERENSGYAALVNDTLTYCFALNIREGSCYRVEVAKNLFIPVSCSSPQAVSKIDRRVDGSTDESKCPSGTKAITFPEPVRLYCVSSP